MCVCISCGRKTRKRELDSVISFFKYRDTSISCQCAFYNFHIDQGQGFMSGGKTLGSPEVGLSFRKKKNGVTQDYTKTNTSAVSS